jgi:hypothetical protein
LRGGQNAAALDQGFDVPLFGSEATPPVPRPRKKPQLKMRPEVIEVDPGLPIVLVPPDPSFVPAPPPTKKRTPSEINNR